jgi:hypothetical protein
MVAHRITYPALEKVLTQRRKVWFNRISWDGQAKIAPSPLHLGEPATLSRVGIFFELDLTACSTLCCTLKWASLVHAAIHSGSEGRSIFLLAPKKA